MNLNKSLSEARRNPKDEFYTQLAADIENELKHYKEHFRGKQYIVMLMILE